MYNSKSPKYKRSPTISTAPFQPRQTSRASSLRRLKLISLLFVIALTLILFYRSSTTSSHSVSSDFYHKTKTALDLSKEDLTPHSAKKPASKAEAVAEALGQKVGEVKEDTKQRLQDAAKEAKDKANAKAPKPDNPASIVGVGSSEEGGVGSGSGKSVSEPGAGGRKKWSTGDDKQAVVKEENESDEDHEVEVELNSILKKAPVIIFSKSYCPHSARAKSILLEKYILIPPPFVVELDKHPLGLNLQASLASKTKRKTVPNVLVNGVSIGGGDDIAALDESKELVDKIKSIAGKKMTEVRPRAGASKEREDEKNKKAPVRGSDGAI